MKKLCLVSLMMAALGQGALAADNSYMNNVNDSFQRMVFGDRNMDYGTNVDFSFAQMLNHQPYTGPVTSTGEIGSDPVEVLVNAIVRGETTLPVTGAGSQWANLEMSFSNLFSHEPYTGETATTVTRGEKDPVEAAVQAMLRDEPRKGISVASEKSADSALAF